jgi:hypothetical protein
MISSITETKIQCTLKVSHHMFCIIKVNTSGFYQILTQGVHKKHISGLVFIRYITEPIICLYRVASTNSDEVSTRSFNFVSMGVYMDLHFNMSNLFIISTVVIERFASPLLSCIEDLFSISLCRLFIPF